MIRLLYTLLILTIVSCRDTQAVIQFAAPKTTTHSAIVSIPTVSSDTSYEVTLQVSEDAGADAMQTYYVVIADTGLHYDDLRQQMVGYQQTLSQQIDTMDRTYDKTKDLIALPAGHDDEIYAGEYYPRRFPSSTLSLEYLNFYQQKASEKSIALVTGIYERQESADSALSVLEKVNPAAFVIKSNIYIGCMH